MIRWLDDWMVGWMSGCLDAWLWVCRGWVRTRYTPYTNVEEMAKRSHSYMEGKG